MRGMYQDQYRPLHPLCASMEYVRNLQGNTLIPNAYDHVTVKFLFDRAHNHLNARFIDVNLRFIDVDISRSNILVCATVNGCYSAAVLHLFRRLPVIGHVCVILPLFLVSQFPKDEKNHTFYEQCCYNRWNGYY